MGNSKSSTRKSYDTDSGRSSIDRCDSIQQPKSDIP